MAATAARAERLRTVGTAALALWAAAAGAQESIADSRRTAVVRAVERVQPAVVSIHVVYRERVVYRYTDPFRDFFFGGLPFTGRYYLGERDRISGGSGFVVDSKGWVLTNAHVLMAGERGKIQRLEVSLPDGRAFQARSFEADEVLDLAVIEVKAPSLPVAPLGDSDHILVGEWAIAIGNPFDLGTTVSIGVISAIGRDFQERQGDYYYRDMIQTDAAINPGNSGGPLVNALGEVIGVNSFIFTGGQYSLGSIGIGFAIPIAATRRFLEEVQTHGRVRRPWHGVLDLQDLTPRWAEYLELDSADGAVVAQVTVGSPADQAGLERGDVILALNGESVRSAAQAWSILQGLRVDERCVVKVLRGGQSQTLSFRVAEHPASGSRWD